MPRHARPPTDAERAWADEFMWQDNARTMAEFAARGEHMTGEGGWCWCQPTMTELPNGNRYYTHRDLLDAVDPDADTRGGGAR